MQQIAQNNRKLKTDEQPRLTNSQRKAKQSKMTNSPMFTSGFKLINGLKLMNSQKLTNDPKIRKIIVLVKYLQC